MARAFDFRGFRVPYRRSVAAGLVLVIAMVGCGQPSPPLPPIQVQVDPSVTPTRDSIPGFEDGEPRPLAAVANEDGQVADFVANEVWLATDDQDELDAFLARWNGTVLSTFDPTEAGITGLPTQYLIRVDTSTSTDPAADLSEDLRSLDEHATGTHGVSSQQGLELLGVTSQEAVDGLDVGINWVGGGAGPFTDRTTVEAPTGQSMSGIPYFPDAFSWPTHAQFSEQEIGVAEAWRALDMAGKLGNRIKLAILDMGFSPDDDMPAGWVAISNVPLKDPIGTPNLLWCGGGNDCPWHGQMVASSAMAVADNGFGTAGSAGPVADAVLVYTLYDFFTSITALGEARIAGARIANMSYSAPVPWYLGWTVLPFEAATIAFRETGMLLFAAAGNEGKNVDSEGCTLGVCWERTWVTPCENGGVICVGGMAVDKTEKAENSNYGGEQVDIFAPFTFWMGPDPDQTSNFAHVINGTSFSSPFAAGVAALIWAADPGQSADDVEDRMMSTAHPNADSRVKRHLNALAAVLDVLGNVPPSITLSPSSGDVPVDVPLTFTATVFDIEDAFPCCTVTWNSNVDGNLGSGTQVEHTFTTLGVRTITATATDKGGASSQASITIDVVNDPPTVQITAPTDGAEVFRGAGVVLRGSGDDVNEPGGELECEDLVWTSSVPGDADFPTTGCEVQVTFPTNGARTLTLTGTDGRGATGTDTVSVNVVEPPPNLPPNVQITSPSDHPEPAPPIDQPLTLSATVSDPENDLPLTYQWTVKLGSDTAFPVGTNDPTVMWTPNSTYAFNQEGTWSVEVRLTVTDSEGNVGSDAVTVVWLLIF